MLDIRRSNEGLCVLLAVVLGAASVARGQETPAWRRMQKVSKRFVKETGSDLIGVGSWINGKTYTPGVSDHDMRLLVPNGTPPGKAADSWRQSRETLQRMIREEFGDEAPEILKRTNLYPPGELMDTVEDAHDAARAYRKYNAVPTLSHKGPVNGATAKRYSEGLYGKGAAPWKQHYEATKGKLFYGHKGKAYAGPTDLTHLAEGRRKFTSSGMADTTRQWLDHAVDEARHGRPDRAAKYLERAERDLHKARQLGKSGSNTALQKELQSLINDLKKPGASMAAHEKRFARVAGKAGMEASILTRLENAGPAQRELLERTLSDLRRGGSFSEKILNAAKKVPIGTLLNGMLMVAVAHHHGGTAGERSIAEALAKAIPDLASLPAGILVEITDHILESAKAGGGALSASSQEAWDLVSGIHSARGREKVFRRTGGKGEYDIDMLVRRIHTREKLSVFVEARARQSADRGGGGALDAGDRETATAIYNRCFPIIFKAWQAKRDEIRREYIRLAQTLRTAQVVIVYSPSPAQMPADDKPLSVKLRVLFPGTDLGKILPRMQECLAILVGKGTFANRYVKFTAKGREGARDDEMIVTVKKPGVYKTGARVRFSCGGTDLGDLEFLKLDVTRTASVELEVLSAGGAVFVGAWNNGDKRVAIKFTIQGKVVTGTFGMGSLRKAAYDPATGKLSGETGEKTIIPIDVGSMLDAGMAGLESPALKKLRKKEAAKEKSSIPLEVDARYKVLGRFNGKGFTGTLVPFDEKKKAIPWRAAATLPPSAPKTGGAGAKAK